MGKLRNHNSKEVADLAKEIVKKWKTEVEKEKQGGGSDVKSEGRWSLLPFESALIFVQ